MKKKFLVIISVLLNAMLLQAASIPDDFNRADRAANGNGALIGANWVSSRGGWGIEDGRLIQNMSSTQGNAVLYNTALETISGNGTNFTVSLDVMALGLNAWAGMAFNFQDADNFYWFRYKGGASDWSLSRFVGGNSTHIASGRIDGTFSFNTDYTLKVNSSAAYTFSYEIKEAVTGLVLVSGTATDAKSSFTGGYAGVLQSTVGIKNSFDNFSVEVIPEPVTVGMLGFPAGAGAKDQEGLAPTARRPAWESAKHPCGNSA